MLEKIGKYEIRLPLGSGAMGVVYEGYDAKLKRRVAVKTLRTDQFDASQLPDLFVRFEREAEAIARLSHPHIVTIHEYGEWEGTRYIVMEYISGRELKHDLERRARFPLEDVVRIMTQMLGALGHAHERGVVHRDLKPANIFLLDDGSLKVVDFGIARLDDADATLITRSGDVLGTPAYMSPEQVEAKPVDHRSDLFSAGIILYELLVGERPFKGESVHTVKLAVQKLEPLAPSEANPTLTEAWDKVISRALSKKPAARYENARQFSEAIKAAFHAERGHAEEGRLKAAEANEHALRAAEERSRAESLRRAEEERREAERLAKAEAQARQAAEDRARSEAQARAAAEAQVKKAAGNQNAATPKPAQNRALAIAAAVLAALAILATVLYTRQSAEDQASKSEAARVAAESRAREESEKRAKAEALARDEAAQRSKLESEVARKEAEAKREAELAAKARAEEEAKKAAEDKAKALVLKKEDEAKTLALKKDAEAKALTEADARRKAEDQAKAAVEKKADRKAEKKADVAGGAAQKPGAVFQDCPDCPRMVVIPAGEFTMGSPASEVGRDADEGPQHRVAIANPFALGRNEVTVAQFRSFVDQAGYKTEGERNVRAQGCRAWEKSDGKFEWRAGRDWRSPGFEQSGSHPVVCVSWNDARAFAEWLSKKTGQRYRLPTESEWEYATRAGAASARYWGESADEACAYANVADQTTHDGSSWSVKHNCSDGHWFPAAVGSYKPNRFGLYDTLGNVWEWTEDCWNAGFAGAPTDGSAWTSGNCSVRVSRGGSWNLDPRGVRSASRGGVTTDNRYYGLGCRLARTLD